MKRILVTTFLLCLGSIATADTTTDDAFENLADEYISDLTNFSPVFATYIGDHSADGQLDDVDAASRAR